MANFPIPEKPEFNHELRMFETTDPAHANLFNAVVGRIFNNLVYLYKNSGATAEDYENLKNVVEKHINSVTLISYAEIDALGNMEPGPEPGPGGGSCSCESITDEEIQHIIESIISSGGSGGGSSLPSCDCSSITAKEIQTIIDEIKRRERAGKEVTGLKYIRDRP